jgi:hypothetical protein
MGPVHVQHGYTPLFINASTSPKSNLPGMLNSALSLLRAAAS